MAAEVCFVLRGVDGADSVIRDMDDGDDLEEESNEFDLRPGRDKSVTLNFEVPLEVDEDTYDVDIHVEGEDENGTTHEVDWIVYLEVEKDLVSLHLSDVVKANLVYESEN